jgi:hypothetical protein
MLFDPGTFATTRAPDLDFREAAEQHAAQKRHHHYNLHVRHILGG